MNYNYIEIPEEVREWINRLPGYHGINIKENTFTNQERWLLGRTTAQMWNYVKTSPMFNCPLYSICTLDRKHCDEDKTGRPGECWEAFKKWAMTPLSNKSED